jgi:hypothetical protein
MIDHKRKFVFVHIPKTGGTSINTALGSFPSHTTARQYLRKYPQAKQYFKFAIVRNPWDYLVSYYHFYNSPEYRDATTKRRKAYADASTRSFNKWVRWALSGKAIYDRKITRLQLDWVTSANGSVIVDYIGRFETLQGSFYEICDRIGIKRMVLPHEKKGSHKHYSEYYDKSLRDFVGQYYAKDIEAFSYPY